MSHKAGRMTLRQIELINHLLDSFAFDLWGERFTPNAVLSASMSRWASANSFLSMASVASCRRTWRAIRKMLRR